MVFALEGGLPLLVLLMVVALAHRHAKRGERLEASAAIGGRAHMTELTGRNPAARYDAGKAVHPLLIVRLLGYCVIDQPLIKNLRDKSDYHVCRAPK